MMGNLFAVCNRLNEENHKGKLRFPFDLYSMKEGDVERMEDWADGLCTAMSLRSEVWELDGSREEADITEDAHELAGACAVVMGVARHELIPRLFGRPDFDLTSNEDDQRFLASLFTMLPKAVDLLQGHARLKKAEYLDSLGLSGSAAGARREKIGRNDPCPCGSGKKYKKCCGMN